MNERANDWVSVDKDKNQSFYEEYCEITGNTLGWESPISAAVIYEAASNSPYQNWRTISNLLDVGSGSGHLLSFLRSIRGYQGSYTGIEILPMFYDIAIANYGSEKSVEFILADFLQYPFDNMKFDWVVSLGSLSVKQDDQLAYDWAMCQKMIRLSHFGVSIYINDPMNSPAIITDYYPNLAWHKTHDFENMLKEMGVKEVQAVHFPISVDAVGTIVHAKVQQEFR